MATSVGGPLAAKGGGIAPDRRLAVIGLVLGPVLLVVGLAIGLDSDDVARLVPLERAWVQGAIALPMLPLAPAVLSLAWSDVSVEPAARWTSRGIALAILP